MTDTMDRERIDALTLDELHDEAWETYAESGESVALAFWHEGAPDWYEADADAEYRTAVVFGVGPYPQLAGWTLADSFGLGKRECPLCAPDHEARPALGAECPLCECPVEAGRGGHIYLGEDCAQAVYHRRRVGPEEWAHVTEHGFRAEVFGALFMDYGLRVTAPGGRVVFESPFYLCAQSWGVDEDTGVRWTADEWQEALAEETEALLDELEAVSADAEVA